MAAMRDWSGALRRKVAEQSKAVDNIVVPLDGSEAAKSALPVARTIAELEQATVHVLFTGSPAGSARPKLEELGLKPSEFHGAILNQAIGELPQAIRQLAAELHNAVIVMSTCAGGDVDKNKLGSMADGVLALAPESLLFVRPAGSGQDRGERDEGRITRAEWRIRRIVMAHDGSPSAQAALGPVADLAQHAEAEVLCLHIAARGTERPNEPGSIPAPRYVDQPQHEWPAWAGEFVNRMLALGAPPAAVTFKLLVAGGQPGSEIAQFAHDHDVDLVVLPWHGHWVDQRGGAVDVVVRTSGCPVLLFRTAHALSR
jgi:nucleotide-binding universal stress UspA family protein